ncbi:MAG: Ldh family oxidoreductase [Methylobacterium frigidaeris]
MTDERGGPSRIEAGILRSFAAALLRAGGFTSGQAADTADLLVWANLRGADSHGVLRIPRYVEMVRQGLIQPEGAARFSVERGAVAVLDADRVPAATVMTRAVARASDLADASGVGWCAVRGTTHAGAIGYFAEALARNGKVGLVFTASKPLMIYHGARAEGVSTNPLAIAAPVGSGILPFLLDMSTAAVALGKIMAARDAGRPIPAGWGVDRDGAVTTDPGQVAAVLPMAGPKGSGLSLMIEVLASVLAGSPIIAAALSGGGTPGFNGTVIAVDPGAFGPADAFLEAMERLRDAIAGLPPAIGADAVRLPGERGYATAGERSAGGIPLVRGTVARLTALASELGVAVPHGMDRPSG